MRTDSLHPDWRIAYHVDDFLTFHLHGCTSQTKRDYLEVMSSFISHACEIYECSPGELDFSRCHCIEIGDEVVYDQVNGKMVKEYLESIPYPTKKDIAGRVLRAYFNFLLDDNKIRFNPAPRRKVKTTPNPQRVINLDDVETLARYLRQLNTPYSYALLIQLASGRRIGEVLALRTEDVTQTPKQTWEIWIQRPESNKTKTAAKLPLPTVTQLLRDWYKYRDEHEITSEYLFARPGNKPLRYSAIKVYLRKVCTQLGIQLLQLHDLRRAYATLMERTTNNPEIVRQSLTQSRYSGRTTMRYVSPVSIQKMDNELGRLHVRQLADRLASSVFQGGSVHQLDTNRNNEK